MTIKINPQLGVDLQLDGNAGWLADERCDLALSPRGDLTTVDDFANVRQALIRRLNTPRGELWAHPRYGNPLWRLLSEPIDDNFIAQAKAALRECIGQEPRVRLLELAANERPEQRTVEFAICYALLDDTRIDNLVWTIDSERVMASV